MFQNKTAAYFDGYHHWFFFQVEVKSTNDNPYRPEYVEIETENEMKFKATFNIEVEYKYTTNKTEAKETTSAGKGNLKVTD